MMVFKVISIYREIYMQARHENLYIFLKVLQEL
jgi:hypothetical protein